MADSSKLVKLDFEPVQPDENPPEKPSRWRRFARLVRNIALTLILISIGVLGTFIFTGNLTFTEYSNRLFWVGFGLTLIAGIVMVASNSVRKQFGVPTIITKPEHARNLLTHMVEIQAKVNERVDAAILIWVVSILLIGLSALVQTVGERIGGG